MPSQTFKFSGRILEAFNDDAPNPRWMNDTQLLDALEESSESIEFAIEQDIRSNVRYALSHGSDDLDSDAMVDVSVSIDFHSGSILFTGLAILEWMGKIDGAISLTQRVMKLIRSAILRTLRNRTGNRKCVVVVVPVPVLGGAPPSPAGSSEPLFGSAQILLAITLLNAVMFIGGSVYTGISVNSIEQRFREASDRTTAAQEQYEKRVEQLRARTDETEALLKRVDTGAENLSASLSEAQTRVGKIREMAAEVAAGWIGPMTVLRQSNWWLRGIMAVVAMSTIVLIVWGIVGFIRS